MVSSDPQETRAAAWMPEAFEEGLVTVIIPTYNRARLVIEAMASVVEQDYRPIELLVVDDGSTDDTRALAEQWVADHAQSPGFRACVTVQPNSGAPVARNAGLAMSAGEYVQFLDSDDLLLPTKVSRQVEHLRANLDAPGSYSMSEYMDPAGAIRETVGRPPVADRALNAVMPLFDSNCPLWRRRAIAVAGPWDEDLVCRQDWVFRSRILWLVGPAAFLPEPLCVHRLHDGDRISKHGDVAFIEGIRTAVHRIAAMLDCAPETTAARNYLATHLLAACKGFLRERQWDEADAALNEARQMAHGSVRRRMTMIRTVWGLIGPRLFRRVLAFGRRL